MDPSLGRVDHEALPQQALMEMVIEGVKNKEAKDIEQWEGVIVENSKVVKINCRDWFSSFRMVAFLCEEILSRMES